MTWIEFWNRSSSMIASLYPQDDPNNIYIRDIVFSRNGDITIIIPFNIIYFAENRTPDQMFVILKALVEDDII